jgi:hypothetical protein
MRQTFKRDFCEQSDLAHAYVELFAETGLGREKHEESLIAGFPPALRRDFASLVARADLLVDSVT